MKFNIFMWCDEKISQLKESGIQFSNGLAVLPLESIYSKPVRMISSYKYRNDIPENIKAESLLCNFTPDIEVIARLKKIDKDLPSIKEYGGICGQDLSPSIGMLRPRQKFSIFINSLYNAYMAIHGIKILPNSRIGDMGTMAMSRSFPNGVNFIAGMHGCKKYGFKEYGLHQLRMLVREKKPPILYIYGTLTIKEAKRLFWKDNFIIVTFPDRRNRVRNNSKAYIFHFNGHNVIKSPYNQYSWGGVA